jgi:hypothetical protein
MTTAVQVITDDNTRDKRAIPITFLVGSKSITLTPLLKSQSTRFLGVWVSLSKSNNFIFNQVKSIVHQNCNIMKRKFLTDLQLQYIFNRVLAPQIEYRTQLTIFNEFQCAQLFAPLRKLFKYKIGLASIAPNYITDCHSIYNVSNLSDLQLLSHASKLHKQLNNDSLLGDVTRIRLRNLQTSEWMVSNPLVSWSQSWNRRFRSNLIAATLSIMHGRKFNFDPVNLDKNIISGGEYPLVDIMGPTFFKSMHIKSMIKHKILFLSQLTSCDGTLLLKWQDLNYKPQFHNLRRTPLWYNHLENLVLQSPLTSHRLTALFCTLP